MTLQNSFKNRILILLLSCFGLLSCGLQNTGMTYSYSDQNNNRFQITPSQVFYIPMTASESSSGQYNGGEKVTVTITEETFKEISNLAEAVFASDAITTQRRMMTSVLRFNSKGKNKQVIVTASEERKQLEKLLRELIQ